MPAASLTRRAGANRQHYDLLREAGLCVRCQAAPAFLGLSHCQGCLNDLAETKASEAKPTPQPVAEPKPALEYGDGLPIDHPNRSIEFNPNSWRPGQPTH